MHVYARAHTRVNGSQLLSRTNYGESVVYTGEYPGMFAGGPLFEKIRLDNATIRRYNRGEVGAAVRLNKKRKNKRTKVDEGERSAARVT